MKFSTKNVVLMTQIRFLVASVAVVMLNACGGGGGGSSAPATTTPPVTSNSSNTPLQFTDKNASAVSASSFGFGVLIAGFGQTAVDWGAALSSAGGSTTALNCSGGGSVELALTNQGQSGLFSPGSEITATLTNCFIKPAGDPFSGTVKIDYMTATTDYQETAVINFQSGFADTSEAGIYVTGALQFDYNASATDKTLHVYSAATPLHIQFPPSTSGTSTPSTDDELTLIDVSRDVNLQTARVTSSIAFQDASGLFGGSFSVLPSTAFGAWFDAYPDTGALAVSGADGVSVFLIATSGDTPNLTAQYGGATIGTLSVVGLADYLFSGTGWIAADANGTTYSLQAASSQPLTLIAAPTTTSMHPDSTGLTWYFSRTLTSVGAQSQFQTISSTPADSTATTQIQALIRTQDASLTVSPGAQFAPGASYQLFGPSGYVVSSASSGGNYTVAPISFNVADTVSANLVANGPLIILGSTATLQLDASGSTAGSQPVSGYAWSQLSGPYMNIAGNGTSLATISTGNPGNGVAIIQLFVSNANRDQATQQISIPVYNDTTSATVIGYKNPGDMYYTMLTDLTTTGAVSVSSSNAGSTITVGLGAAQLVLSNDTGVLFSGGSTVTTPDGSGSQLSWTGPDGTTCSSPTTGQFNVLNVTYSGTTVQSLAADFSVTCNGVTTTGVVRINSATAVSL